MNRPDAKYFEAKRLVELDEEEAEKSNNELVKLLLAKKKGTPVVADKTLSKALYIYEAGKQSKLLMEALLLAPDGDPAKIASSMDADAKMVGCYAEYFFDTAVFEDKFDIQDYISELEDPNSRITKMLSLTQGFNYMISHLSGGELNMTPLEICKKTQQLAYKMVQQAAGQAVTKETAKEVKGWTSILKAYTDTIEKLQPSGAEQKDFLQEFRVIMKKDSPIDSIENLEGDLVRG